jgi:hypothetical protein
MNVRHYHTLVVLAKLNGLRRQLFEIRQKVPIICSQTSLRSTVDNRIVVEPKRNLKGPECLRQVSL